jgi:asparagine synthase (glutamine-hydrolysing)
VCGICGVVGFGDLATLETMAETLAHRGPDAKGSLFLADESVGLGFRRLAVIDLSDEGNQPMGSADGLVSLVFNGEIYNFSELRQELERSGRSFRSRTDTEVILGLYERDGPSCIERLDGMFALAVLDRRSGHLLLARDRLGIKPLYYYRGEGRFVFGSEIKSILASGAYRPDLDPQAMRDFFTYLYVPWPQTIFRGILQVGPGEMLDVDLRTLAIERRTYWRPDGGPAIRGAEARGEIRRLLTDAVRRQCVADVPLGVFLSGGVDSPILTGLMAEASPRPVKTFTVVFEGSGLGYYDESSTARAVAKRFGTEHHEVPVRVSDPTAMIDLIRFFDQPFGNPTLYLAYLISRETRREVTVALSGAGGDELFAGYPRYRAAVLARRLQWLPRRLLRIAASSLRPIPDGYRTMTLRRAREFFEGLDPDPVQQLVNWTYFFTEDGKRALLTSVDHGRAVPSERVVRERWDEVDRLEAGNQMLAADIRSFLVDNVLEYTDKMSMAVSLEVRVPYLDHNLVDLALRVPFREKLRGGTGKAILRETFRDLLPAAVASGSKRGFNAPLGAWMRDHLDRYFDLNMPRQRVEREGLMRWESIQRLRAEHRSGRRDNSYELFAILMFDAWYRRYLLGEDVESATASHGAR